MDGLPMDPPDVAALPLEVLCGQLLVGGFAGTTLTRSFAAALAAGHRGGAILFKRNLSGGLADVLALTASILAAAPAALPPLIAVDQEGGRVARLGPPLLTLPPMAVIGGLADAAFAERLAERQGAELAALGFTMNFAPILDVHTRPENPVIGDRAFSREPDRVAELGVAWARGLERGGVLACGKHFPGHGDTTTDSHFELPRVEHGRARLEAIEIPPFAAAARAKIAALMTAHVVFPALDPDMPATLSPAVATDLRSAIAFDGILVSDDLEMKAIKVSVEESAVRAIAAGCDMLLVCESEPMQERAHAALVARAKASREFRMRCREAVIRCLSARTRVPPRPVAGVEELRRVLAASSPIARELTARREKP
jgi:beta-N-acetylhexosaminidase